MFIPVFDVCATAVAVCAFLVAGIIYNAERSYGAEYFVDSLSGADSAAGTSPENAWKSIERVNEAKLAPGDVVRFRRGRVWRGTLRPRSGAEGSPVVYSAYDEGEKPRIMQSADLTDPNLWTRVGDLPIWATEAPSWRETESHEETALFAKGDWHTYCEENARVELEKKTFDGLQGYTLHCEESDERGTYLQFTVNSFPVRARRNVAFKFRARSTKPFTITTGVPQVFMTGKPWTGYANTVDANCQIDGEWRDFQIVFHTTVDADDARLTFFLGSVLPDGADFDFVPLGACELETTGPNLLKDVGNVVLTEKGDAAVEKVEPALKKFAPTYDKRERAGFKRWTLDDVKAPDDFWYDVKSHRLYFCSEENPGARFASFEAVLGGHCCVCAARDVVIENIAFTHTGSHGISSPQSSRIVVRDCDFDWIGGGDLSGAGGDGQRVRFGNGVEFWDGSVDCVVERCRFSRVYDVAITTQGSSADVSRNLIMRDNVMFRCEQAFEIWFTNPETVVEGLVFERNLCVSCGRDWSHVQRPDKTATAILGYNLDAKTVDITIRQNVFCDTAQFFVKCWHNRVDEYTIDDNVYWVYPETPERPLYSGDKFFCFGASQGKAPLSYDEFRATTKHDKKSRWIEPKFRDFEKDDFTLLNRDELGAGPLE